MMYDKEVVEKWKQEFEANDVPVDVEILDAEGSISNERLWINGSSTREEAMGHEQNIANYEEYLARLWNKAKERR